MKKIRFPYLRKSAKRSAFILSALLIAGVIIFIYTYFFPSKAQASWFDESWLYRIPVPISAHTTAETNVYITATLDTSTPIAAGKMQSDCGDLRFTKENGEVLPYFINASPGCNNAATTIQVNFDSFPAGAQTIYYYYGNTSASNAANAAAFSTEAANYTVGSLGSETQGPGPVGYWKFDDGQGTTAKNATSTTSIDGTLAGTTVPAWQPEDRCVSGKCLFFDGSTSYIDSGNNASLRPTKLTASAWIRGTHTADAHHRIVAEYDGTNNNFILGIYNKKLYGFVWVGNTQYSFSGNTALTDNVWYHASMTYDGETIYLYLNGKLDGTLTNPSGNIDSDTVNLRIGNDSSNAAYYKGFIDEPKIYPYARTAAQVKTDYDAGKNNAAANSGTSAVLGSSTQDYLSNGLVGYWKMDESSGTTVTDASGNSNTGTLTNAQETNGENNFDSSSTTTIVDGSRAALSSTDSVYNGMIIALSNRSGQTCSVNGNQRTISAYTGATKTITVPVAFTAAPEVDKCIYTILHQVGGKYGNSLQFDTQGKYVSVADSNSMLISGSQITLGAWVKWNGTSPDDYSIILEKGWSDSYGLRIDNNRKVKVRFLAASGTNFDWTSSATVANGSWTHVVVTFNQPNVNVYINGAQADSTTWDNTIQAYAGTLTMGDTVNGASGHRRFNGNIDEARIYNRALSSKEVSDLYNWAPGPIGYWDFEENTGTTTKDKSTNANTGTLGGNGSGTDLPTWDTGKYGAGLKFDGSDDYVSAGTGSSLRGFENHITLEAWVKVKSFASEFDVIAGRTVTNGITPTEYPLIIGLNSGKPTARMYYGAVYEAAMSTTLALDTWYHITGTYDQSLTSGNIKLYINGVLQTQTNFTRSLVANTREFIIGDRSPSPDYPFAGTVDEVKVYNYARTHKQILEDMNGGGSTLTRTVSANSPVAYWKLDQGQGTTASDSTSNANNLTLSSASWTDSGKFGKAWNGTGALWLSRADDSDFDFAAADDGSISLWFKSDSATNPSATEYLFSKGPIKASSAGYAIYANTSGQLCFGVDDDTAWGPDDSACTTSDIYDAAWHHLVAEKTGTTEIRLYVDGVSKASDTSIAATSTLANSQILYIGDSNGADGGDEFNGDLDEIKVYRYALTADEVKLDYNRGSSEVLGGLGTNSSYAGGAANQEYCIPGDTSTCTAPVGRWDFEEGRDNTCTGGTNDVCDTSGNGNDGAWSGTGSHWNQGKIGKGGNFNGSNDFVSAGNNSSLMPENAITVEAWIKTSGLGSGNWPSFVSKRDGTLSPNTGFQLRPNWDSNIFEFGIATGGGGMNWVQTTPILNQWVHLAGTYDKDGGSNNLKLYLNGVVVHQKSSSTGTINSNSENVLIGKMLDGGNSYFLKGQVDQVRIFNYARTPAQVAYDYNRGAPVGHWKLDECQGNSAKDSSGNGNHGTITIGASGEDTLGTCTTSSTAWGSGATGKRNASLSLGGTDDYINVSSTTGLISNAKAISVTAWIKTTATTGVIYGEGNTSVTNPVIQLEISSSKLYAFTRDNAGTYNVLQNTGSNVNSGNWTHIAMTVDSNGKITGVYINGQLIGSATTNTLSTLTTTNTKIGTLFYGSAPTGMDFFNGQIDDVRIYNYALTPVQVKDVYNNGAVNFGPSTGSP